jgi:signal transduction histidine kinase
MTERKQIEEELRASREQLRGLSQHLHAAREEERRRIAREIHDELGGALTGLKMDISALRKVAQPTSALVREKTDSIFESIDAIIKNIRRIATELRPSLLDEFGLAAALEWQLQEFEARSGIRCRLHLPPQEIRLPPDAATAVFRVFQETLTNVARHSHATEVEVRVENLSDCVTLQVRDNGRGISHGEIHGRRSLGLLGMHERVRALAGMLEIEGTPGVGTAVVMRIPAGAGTDGQMDGRPS